MTQIVPEDKLDWLTPSISPNATQVANPTWHGVSCSDLIGYFQVYMNYLRRLLLNGAMRFMSRQNSS